MTFLLWYFGGLITALLFNYALHQPNRDHEEKLKELEDNRYRNSGH
jgi:hypothetical protein